MFASFINIIPDTLTPITKATIHPKSEGINACIPPVTNKNDTPKNKIKESVFTEKPKPLAID